MQQQLKACGDLKTSSTARSSMHHRRSSGSGATRKTSGNNGYLATDVTTLDINTMYQSKKSKRNAAATAPSSPFQFLNGNQPPTFQFPSYMSPAAFYNNLDLLNSGELPPLMSVPAFKPNLLHGFGDTNSTAMDFAQFTEELNAIQNSSPSTLQSLFTSPDTSSAAFLSSMPKNPTASGASHNNRNSAGRKNRMVEVKTINDRPVVLVSDPQSASANSRTHMVPIRCQLMGFPKKLEESKKKPVSPEPLYSRKVFIGGLPIDVTEEEVWTTFGSFGKVLVDWPRRPEHGARADLYDNDVGRRNSRSVSGYVFLVFQNESSVQELVNACELYDGKYYLQLSSPTMSDKAVQVRAWRLADIDYFADPNALVDHRRTVFIGGVPRPTRASDLAKSLQEHYGKVSYVGIDIDPELKYPKGAARVTFASSQSFVRAISGRFVQVTHADTNKRVEIKPYVMEDQCCDECQGKLCGHSYASYFCGDPKCLQYYCEACWDRMHYEMQDFELRTTRAEHRPMVRTGDQTRVLNRPPHHPSGNRGHQNQQNLNQNQNHSQNLMYQGNRQNHQSHQNHQDQQPQNQSIISRIVNRNHSVSPPASISSAGSTAPQTIKPFSAIPTTIGY